MPTWLQALQAEEPNSRLFPAVFPEKKHAEWAGEQLLGELAAVELSDHPTIDEMLAGVDPHQAADLVAAAREAGFGAVLDR